MQVIGKSSGSMKRSVETLSEKVHNSEVIINELDGGCLLFLPLLLSILCIILCTYSYVWQCGLFVWTCVLLPCLLAWVPSCREEKRAAGRGAVDRPVFLLTRRVVSCAGKLTQVVEAQAKTTRQLDQVVEMLEKLRPT